MSALSARWDRTIRALASGPTRANTVVLAIDPASSSSPSAAMSSPVIAPCTSRPICAHTVSATAKLSPVMTLTSMPSAAEPRQGLRCIGFGAVDEDEEPGEFQSVLVGVAGRCAVSTLRRRPR